MVRALDLAQRLRNILQSRGKTASFTVDCIVRDDADGLPPRLAFWDEVKLGLTPTQAEVDAAPSTPTADQVRLTTDEAERQAAAIDAAVMALVNATPAGLTTWARNNFPTLTLAEQNRMGMLLNILAVAVRPHVR